MIDRSMAAIERRDNKRPERKFMMGLTSKGSPVMETCDPWMASYFFWKGGKILDMIPGAYVRFLLENHNGEADQAYREYVLEDARVPARQFASVMKFLKGEMRRVQEGLECNLTEFKLPAARR